MMILMNMTTFILKFRKLKDAVEKKGECFIFFIRMTDMMIEITKIS